MWAINDVSGAGTLNPLVQMHNVTSNSFSGQSPADATVTPYLIQAGVVSFTTDSGGNSNISFPSTFPNGCLTLLAQISFGGGFQPTWYLQFGTNVSAGGCGCRAFQLTGTSTPWAVLANTFMSVDFIAIGW